jgi:hypothetical protein
MQKKHMHIRPKVARPFFLDLGNRKLCTLGYPIHVTLCFFVVLGFIADDYIMLCHRPVIDV